MVITWRIPLLKLIFKKICCFAPNSKSSPAEIWVLNSVSLWETQHSSMFFSTSETSRSFISSLFEISFVRSSKHQPLHWATGYSKRSWKLPSNLTSKWCLEFSVSKAGSLDIVENTQSQNILFIIIIFLWSDLQKIHLLIKECFHQRVPDLSTNQLPILSNIHIH